METKEIIPSKHRKNKSTFDNSLAFDIQGNIRPTTKFIQHKNYNSSLYQKKNNTENNLIPNRPKSNIKTMEKIKNNNPALDCLNDKFNLTHINAEELRREKAKTPVIITRKKTNNYKNNDKMNFAGGNDNFNNSYLK